MRASRAAHQRAFGAVTLPPATETGYHAPLFEPLHHLIAPKPGHAIIAQVLQGHSKLILKHYGHSTGKPALQVSCLGLGQQGAGEVYRVHSAPPASAERCRLMVMLSWVK